MQLLVVVDMQEDFVRGALTVPGAEEIIPGIKAKVEDHLIKDESPCWSILDYPIWMIFGF